MSAENAPRHRKETLVDKIPHRGKIIVGIVATAALFFNAAPSSSASEAPEPTPTPSATATPLEISPTPTPTIPEPTETTPAPEETEPTPEPIPTPEPTETTPPPPETEIVTTNTPLRIRTTNVTGKHMDGHKGNGYNKRKYYATWDERKAGLIKDITGIKVDAMGLQEVDAGTQSNYIRSELGKRGYETLPA